MAIEKLTTASDYPWDLLLEADPEKRLVEAYLKKSDSFLYRDEHKQVVGIIVIQQESLFSYEIMNVSVTPQARKKGIAKQLLHYAMEYIHKPAGESRSITVKTGDLSTNALALYKSCGFHLEATVKNYFVEHYKQPIYENGQLLKHLVILKKEI